MSTSSAWGGNSNQWTKTSRPRSALSKVVSPKYGWNQRSKMGKCIIWRIPIP
ncbi:UNVERIFIED_CONTAM: hypothetical protein GTU68_037915 [Idotea baltica]|nr:hypothetical protein [Idotea baltica]